MTMLTPLKSVALIALITTSLLGLGCTPSSNQNTPGAEPTDEIQKISDQETILESVGLKFSIQVHEQQGQEITYVTWDVQVRQEWLDTHEADDIALQAQELQTFVTLAEAEQAILDEEGSEDVTLQLKINLAKTTLSQIE